MYVCTEAHHRRHGNAEQHTLVGMFKGDLVTSLTAAADAGQLNDWLISLAPMGMRIVTGSQRSTPYVLCVTVSLNQSQVANDEMP